MTEHRRSNRPRGLSEVEAFTWLMPGNPPNDGCWDWPMALDSKGYGQFSMNGGRRVVRAHRISYQKFHGEIPDDALILHSCDRRICVHPAHLSLGTYAENMAQARERGRLATGERAEHARLTDSDVIWIRTSGLSNIYMAKVLHVSDATICNARQGKSWQHIPMPEAVNS
jgi:hypothetical protein